MSLESIIQSYQLNHLLHIHIQGIWYNKLLLKRALIKRCAKPFSVHSTEKGAHVCNTAIVKNLVKSDKDDDEIEDEEFFIDWYLEGLEDLLIK